MQFLAMTDSVHPRIVAAVGPAIRGVGAGMIYGVVNLADELGVRVVWGEATVNSARFYEKVLKLPGVTDHFFIDPAPLMVIG